MKIKSVMVALFLFSSVSVKAVSLNDPAPEFTLPVLSGQQIDLKDLQGKVVFVNFWASWCPPCKIEFPELNRLANEYQDKGLRVLAINIDKNTDRVDKFLKSVKIKPDALQILLDPKSMVVSAYEAKAMPTSFIIDHKGVVRFVHLGYTKDDPQHWRKEIDSLLAAQ